MALPIKSSIKKEGGIIPPVVCQFDFRRIRFLIAMIASHNNGKAKRQTAEMNLIPPRNNKTPTMRANAATNLRCNPTDIFISGQRKIQSFNLLNFMKIRLNFQILQILSNYANLNQTSCQNPNLIFNSHID